MKLIIDFKDPKIAKELKAAFDTYMEKAGANLLSERLESLLAEKVKRFEKTMMESVNHHVSNMNLGGKARDEVRSVVAQTLHSLDLKQVALDAVLEIVNSKVKI